MSRVKDWWGRTSAGLPGTYWFLWGGMLVNKLGTFVLPFLALYLTQERGLSVEAAGSNIALYGLGSLTAGPVGGALADRIGRRRTMVVGLSLSAIAMIHLYFARSPGHIALATLALGLVADLYRPASAASVADLVAPEHRTRAYGLIYWAVNLGVALGLILAGLLSGRGFAILFAGDAGTSLVFAAIVWLRVPETRPERKHADEPRPSFLTPLSDGSFLFFVLLSFLLAMVFLQHVSTLPLDMSAHGISRQLFGFLIAINGTLIVLLQPSIARWLTGIRRSRALALGTLLVGIGFGLGAWATTPALYGASIAIWTFGEMGTLPIGPSVVSDLASTHVRGAYQGVYQVAWGAAFLVAPWLGSRVLGHWGARALWGGCFLVCLLAAVGHLAAAGARQRRIAILRGPEAMPVLE